jgi:hypothetical protein
VEINKMVFIYCKKLEDIWVSSIQNIHIWNSITRPTFQKMLEKLTVSEGNAISPVTFVGVPH